MTDADGEPERVEQAASFGDVTDPKYNLGQLGFKEGGLYADKKTKHVFTSVGFNAEGAIFR